MKRLSLFITLIALIGFSATAQQSNFHPREAKAGNLHEFGGKRKAIDLVSTRDFDTAVWANIVPCDDTVTMWYFSAPHDWLSGHNLYVDSAKAERYKGITGDNVLGIWAFFGDATYTSSTTQKCHLRVWDDNGASGSPGTRLASVDVTHAKIAADVAAGNLTTAYFTTPIALPAGGNFYVGVELDYKLKQGVPTWDSNRVVGLYNTIHLVDGDPNCTDTSLNSAWEKWSDGTWHSYADVYGIGVRNPVYPVVGTVAGCTVTITPSSAAICKGKAAALTASGATTYSWAPSTGLNCTTCATVSAKPNATTTYTVTGDGGACSATVTVTVNPAPSVNVTQAACANHKVKLTAAANPNTGVTYQWYKGNAVISGATMKTYSATATASYKVKVTITATGCNKTSTPVSVTVSCKTTDEESVNFDASVYPNPFTKSFNVNIATGSTEPANVELLDFSGRIINTFNNVDASLPLEINENLSAGVYFVRVIQGTSEKMLKVVKND